MNFYQTFKPKLIASVTQVAQVRNTLFGDALASIASPLSEKEDLGDR